MLRIVEIAGRGPDLEARLAYDTLERQGNRLTGDEANTVFDVLEVGESVCRQCGEQNPSRLSAQDGGTVSHDRCTATTAVGQPCKARPAPGLEKCLSHSPELQEKMREARRRGGIEPEAREPS